MKTLFITLALLTATTTAMAHGHNSVFGTDAVQYKIATHEQGMQYHYIFTGRKINETRQYLTYNMDMAACKRAGIPQHKFLFETITPIDHNYNTISAPWGNNPSFSFKRNLISNRCILTVRKSADHVRHLDAYNPNRKNVVVVRPHSNNTTRVVVRPNNNRTRVIVRNNDNSRVIVRNRGNNGTRVIIRPKNQHKQNFRKFVKNNSKKHKPGTMAKLEGPMKMYAY